VRCGGRTIDLATDAGDRTLAALCASQPLPQRVRTPTRSHSIALQAFLWAIALGAAFFAARFSKKIDAHGFIAKDTLTALFALGGLLLGRVVASIALVLVQLATIALSGVVWALTSVLLIGARPTRSWPRFFVELRTRARNAATAPFGAPRVTPRAVSLGPVLEPLALVPRDEARGTCVGELRADGDAEIDAFAASIIGVEGRTHGTDVADAVVAPFRLRTDDGSEIAVRIEVGCVYFDEQPIAVTAARGLPVAWGVRTLHGDEEPVNVWVATTGSRVRIDGGRVESDGAIVGDASDPATVHVLRAVATREAPPATTDQLAVDSVSDTSTIAP
jgi:hypothetical protein